MDRLESLAFNICFGDHIEMGLDEKIRKLASIRFDADLVEEFISRFKLISATSEVLETFLQISTDMGDELELGFFTSNTIFDITLSKGKIYSHFYPLSSIRRLELLESNSKWVLAITGEKLFDYNVVKPASPDAYCLMDKCHRRSLIKIPLTGFFF